MVVQPPNQAQLTPGTTFLELFSAQEELGEADDVVVVQPPNQAQLTPGTAFLELFSVQEELGEADDVVVIQPQYTPGTTLL